MTEQDHQEEQSIEEQIAVIGMERFQRLLDRTKSSAERIKVSSEKAMDKALADRDLMEDMNLEFESLTDGLEELANDLEGKESELFGTQKEVEEEEPQKVLDTDPNSHTFQQMIDAPQA